MFTCFLDLLPHAVRFLLLFACAYLCKNDFLSLLNIKSKQRKRLKAVKNGLRCAFSETHRYVHQKVR